jgi:microsomal dipeptidase-like Zn-dependent dipeptidase
MSIVHENDDDQKRNLRKQTKSFCGIEKPLKNFIDHIESLNDLIKELHVVFSSDYVNIEQVNHLMMVYTSNYHDWKKFGELSENFLLGFV